MYTLEECEDAFGANDIDDNEHVCVGLSGTSGACNVRSLLKVKTLFEFFLNKAELSLNSVNSANSGNLVNH